MYVFLGDDHALIDFVREMYRQGLNKGDYIVIAVQEAPYQSTDKFEYTKKCEYFLGYLCDNTHKVI